MRKFQASAHYCVPETEPQAYRGLPCYSGEHPWDVGCYPTLLADDVNLDSSVATKEMMARTVMQLRSGGTGETLLLLGRSEKTATTGNAATPEPRRASHDQTLGGGPSPERLLNSRSGRIHLFPCAPTVDVAFRRYRTRGGFMVSAC